ncbi:MAG TPA: rRNA maturation RNase YbeY [Bacteroidota bacterium]|jgi:probable rRNA maturation factor|nr:rRNA maturation RNase YbeY [Bacteroidota bacterium]
MIRIRVFNAHPKQRIDSSTIVNIARRVFKSEGARSAECNVIFVDDKRMTDLNGRYLDHWHATDVLSFPLREEGETLIEGEVYVNVDQARRQALENGATFRSEFARLTIHGVLHLLGYLDRTSREKSGMSHLEDRYLTLLS